MHLAAQDLHPHYCIQQSHRKKEILTDMQLYKCGQNYSFNRQLFTARRSVSSAASRNFEKGARSRTHFQKAGQPEYFWATHSFNAKHPFNIYLCITILQEAFISIITNFLFLKNTFKIQKIYYNRFLPFLLSRDKKSRTISSSKY